MASSDPPIDLSGTLLDLEQHRTRKRELQAKLEEEQQAIKRLLIELREALNDGRVRADHPLRPWVVGQSLKPDGGLTRVAAADYLVQLDQAITARRGQLLLLVDRRNGRGPMNPKLTLGCLTDSGLTVTPSGTHLAFPFENDRSVSIAWGTRGTIEPRIERTPVHWELDRFEAIGTHAVARGTTLDQYEILVGDQAITAWATANDQLSLISDMTLVLRTSDFPNDRRP